jgi:hypothetical protein
VGSSSSAANMVENNVKKIGNYSVASVFDKSMLKTVLKMLITKGVKAR